MSRIPPDYLHTNLDHRFQSLKSRPSLPTPDRQGSGLHQTRAWILLAQLHGKPVTGWTTPKILSENPDKGPTMVSQARGITMIGARPWVALYNIPIMSTDVSAAQRIARTVSARGGGLPTVQTLGLVHGEDSTEIACMLLDPNQIGADQIQNEVEMLAAEEELDVE